MSSDLVGRLVSATGLDRSATGLVIQGTYQPVGGPGGRIMPPTFPGENKNDPPVYLFERRSRAEDAPVDVVIDQYQSQANRVEAALAQAQAEGRVNLPLFALTASTSRGPVRLTSLDFPHRYADAYLRDSQMDGLSFDDTPYGKALRGADLTDARALYEREPYSLILGAWDSHRAGGRTKVPRVYCSEMMGRDWWRLPRRAGRLDPMNLTGSIDDKAKAQAGQDWKWLPTVSTKKEKKPSAIGHGNIAPNDAPGGGVVERVTRRAWISMAGLANIRFGDVSAEAADLGRATLAALALLGDRLAFGPPSVWLRSGCDLTKAEETIAFELGGGAIEQISVSTSEALAAFEELRRRGAEAGLAMADDVIGLEPKDAVAKAIEYAVTKVVSADEEPAG